MTRLSIRTRLAYARLLVPRGTRYHGNKHMLHSYQTVVDALAAFRARP